MLLFACLQAAYSLATNAALATADVQGLQYSELAAYTVCLVPVLIWVVLGPASWLHQQVHQ